MVMNLSDNAFLAFLENWHTQLAPLPVADVIHAPERTAILAIDVTNGFCTAGPLASPRVARIVRPIVQLFKSAWGLGVRQFILSQDAHEVEAVEFAQWPVHCVAGSREAETVAEIQVLPFFQQMILLPKNSINPAVGSGLPAWLESHPELDTFVVTGDCTDLCTYQLAMYLRTQANAAQVRRRVILPANCVETYDLPVETARQAGVLPHPGDLIHTLFLYHMALNGIEVCSAIVS